MADARVPRPKGISKPDWDQWLNTLDEYRSLDPGEPDYETVLQEKAEAIADQTVALFLEPVTP